MEENIYWIKYDYGFGEWGCTREGLTEQEALADFEARTGEHYDSMQAYKNDDPRFRNVIYTIQSGQAEYNRIDR